MVPSARESLLDAAAAALTDRPWAAVRMVDVAAAAGVSRQTLYNEFSGKQGLARALVRRETDAYLAGVERALAPAGRGGAGPGECVAAAAGWTLRAARHSALLRAALTGGRTPAGSRVPDLVGALHTRAVVALTTGFPGLDPAAVAWACEAAIRLTLSFVVAPDPTDDTACLKVAQLVHELLSGPPPRHTALR